MIEPNKLAPRHLSALAGQLYAGHKHLTFQQRIVSVYRPLYTPLGFLLEWIPEDKRLLEIGCGTGVFLFLAKSLLSLGQSCGFDINQESIQIAQSVNPFEDLCFITGERPALSRIQEADVLLMVDLLHHVPKSDKDMFLKYVLENMKQGSYIIIKDMDPEPWWGAFANRCTDYLSTRSIVDYIELNKLVTLLKDYRFQIQKMTKGRKFIWYHYAVMGQKT